MRLLPCSTSACAGSASREVPSLAVVIGQSVFDLHSYARSMNCSCFPCQNAAFGGLASTGARSCQLKRSSLRLSSSPRRALTRSKTCQAFHTAASNYQPAGVYGFSTVNQGRSGAESSSCLSRIGAAAEIRNTSKIVSKRLAKGRDYQDNENNVTQDGDAQRSVEVLDVFDSVETDYAERPAPPESELFSSEALPEFLDERKVAKRWTNEPHQINELVVLDGCERTSDLREVGKIYDWLKSRGQLVNFGKSMASASEGDRLVTESTLMDSIGLTASKLSPKKWGLTGSSAIGLVIGIALYSILEDLGIDVRPAIALVLGLGLYDSIYLGGTGLTQLFSMWLPYQRRVLVHEAGHVLVAYLLGCPIRGVILNPVQAAKSGIQGQAGTQFWDKTLELELAQNRLSSSTLDRYSLVLFAGIAAEAFVYGEAQGGENDENMFKSFVSQLQPSWSPARMSNQARWAVLQAFLLIKTNRKAHEAVVEALQEGGSLSSLVRAIEDAIA